MKTSTPCPGCSKPITLEDFEDFSSPFTMKGPHCRAKLKETKVIPYLLAGLVVMVPLFIYLAEKGQSFLAAYFPAVEKIPASIVFIGVLYPVYAVYERMNGLIMFNKGNLKLKNKTNKNRLNACFCLFLLLLAKNCLPSFVHAFFIKKNTPAAEFL